MRLKAIWVLCAVALGALVLVTAGCGGGGGTTTVTVAADTTTEETTTEAETTTEETTTTEEETTTEETSTEEDTTTEETDTDTSETDTTTSPDLSFISNENCRQFVKFASDFSNAMSGTGDTDIKEAADEMQKFADEAPDDIRDDFKTLADAYSKIADAMQGVDLSSGKTPSADVIAKLAQLANEIDSAKVTQASLNISAWTTKNCTNG
jgi:hypothetical protein